MADEPGVCGQAQCLSRTSRFERVPREVDAVRDRLDVALIDPYLLDEKRSEPIADCDDPMAERGKYRKAPLAGGMHEREGLVLDVDQPGAR